VVEQARGAELRHVRPHAVGLDPQLGEWDFPIRETFLVEFLVLHLKRSLRQLVCLCQLPGPIPERMGGYYDRV